MWKVCQVLKSGRSQLSSRSSGKNANNLVVPSPAQQQHQSSSCASPQNEDKFDETDDQHRLQSRRRRSSSIRLPSAFTPSEFRASLERLLPRYFLVRIDNRDHEKEEGQDARENDDDENCDCGGGGGNRNRYRRPGRDRGDYWQCRCRCRFGEWVGYTTVVAASIHLTRVTAHLLPSNKYDDKGGEPAENKPIRISLATYFQHSLRDGWCRLFYRAAPILFPDLFKYFYVLPQAAAGPWLAVEHNYLNNGSSAAAPLALVNTTNSSASSGSYGLEEEGFAKDETFSVAVTGDLSESSTSTTATNARNCSGSSGSSSEECAVQTDLDPGHGTMFENLVRQSGRRLAALSRLDDEIGLEHAIGVDLLKRQLYDEAIEYLLGAAQSGHAGAMYNLGVCYCQGYGVRRDLRKAIEFWRAAGDRGHGLSKYQMGVCHARGLGGLAMDHDRVLRYMESAATAGVPEAKTYLAANEYNKGRLESALELLCDAVSAGDSRAFELLKELTLSNNKFGDSAPKKTPSDSVKLAPSINKFTGAPEVRKNRSRTNNRFWANTGASSSSEKEDSLLSSSSSPNNGELLDDDSNSSIIFCDDLLSSDSSSKKQRQQPESVETLLKISSSSHSTSGSLRRSKTAPEFGCFHDQHAAVLVGVP